MKIHGKHPEVHYTNRDNSFIYNYKICQAPKSQKVKWKSTKNLTQKSIQSILLSITVTTPLTVSIKGMRNCVFSVKYHEFIHLGLDQRLVPNNAKVGLPVLSTLTKWLESQNLYTAPSLKEHKPLGLGCCT